MALDSKPKRASVPGVGRPWMRLHEIDVTLDQGWRQNSGLAYGGNNVGALAPVTTKAANQYRGFIVNTGRLMR